MALTTAAAILGQPSDIVTEEVFVPEWNDSVLIRAMSGAERDAFEMANRRKGKLDLRNYRAKFLVRCIVNENGTKILTDAQAVDLGKRSSAVVDRLFTVASKLSGMDDDETEAVEGNSEEEETETSPEGTEDGSDSPSTSPATSA